nr:RNA-directed DNA polymerase, eukaryota [Tanacetum cinerariifolium]
TGVASWFVRICNAQNDFVANERIVWVDIEGVPLHAWYNATFHKIDDESVKKDAVINEVDNSVSTKGEESESEAVSDTQKPLLPLSLDHDNEVDQSINDKEVSNDPFKIYELLNKNKNRVDNSGKEYSIPYPPGFTPDQANVTFVQEAQEIHGEDSIHSHHSADRCSSRIFVAVEKPYINFQPDGRVIKDARKEGGSILDILDEIIKVGQTMGFTMDGCAKDMEKIIGSNGVYAPQSFTSKRLLWDFITSLINQWNGEYLVMGDFNEVRCKEDRWGSTFHAQGARLFYSFISNAGLMEVQLEGYSFTWTHHSASKMSKLDRFLVSDSFLSLFPYISALQDLNSSANSDFIQKAKVRWAIEGDENSKFFHGIINRKRANLSVKGIMIDEEWVEDPIRVKEEFRNHFADRFNDPGLCHGRINFDFPNRLKPEQVFDLETSVSDEEIRKAIWACGENKSPGPDGFTFEFFCKFWLVVGPDFCIAAKWFFDHGVFATGCNSSFVTLIPKTLDPKLVMNGSPTLEFQFHRGLKQGDPLAPFLFILIMESLHLAFNRAVDAGIFSSLRIDDTLTISHLFYADDAIFIGDWSKENLKVILNIPNCFSLLSGMSINLKKSHILGLGIHESLVSDAAASLGCSVMKMPFNYLGIMVGGNMSLVKSWDDSIHKHTKRLSRWKLKTLSIGGRFTLLKSVLGSTPIYNMSIFKVPKSVLNKMESIRRDFFNGIQEGVQKVSWVKGGIEEQQFEQLNDLINSVSLSNSKDRWVSDLNGDGVFRVKDVRNLLDGFFLPRAEAPTRWVKNILIKVNIFAWKVALDRLPTRVVRRNVAIDSQSCPLCDADLEDSSHLFFNCSLARDVT